VRGVMAERVGFDDLRALLRDKRDELERTVERERARLARAAARLTLLERVGHPAARDVAVRAVGPQLVASVRETIATFDQSERLVEELEPAAGRGRVRGAVWHACRKGAIDCEAFVLWPARADVGGGRVRISEWAAQRVASLVYRGDDDYLSAFSAVHAWLALT